MRSMSRTVRAVTFAVTALTVPALVTGCTSTKSGSGGGGGGGSETVKIGLITKTDSNPYFVSMRSAAQDEAKKMGAELTAAAGTADGDNDSQVTAVQNMIASGVKGILITPNDSKAIVPTLLDAQSKGVFVAALDTQTEGNKGVDATWATDNTKAGQQQGAYVKAALGSTTPVLGTSGLVPSLMKATPASTPATAIFDGNCMTVAAIWPFFTAVTPAQPPSIEPTMTESVLLAFFRAVAAPIAAGSLIV